VTNKISREGFFFPEILLEIRRIGKNLRVVAIDPSTGTEIIMVAPLYATRTVIKKNAARKLAYVIAKKKKNGEL
jgi:hypothetical protein